MSLKLYIANQNYSSWSLRPWAVLKFAKIPFEQVIIPLGKENTLFRIGVISPSGRLPVLEKHELFVWDSLAICEYIAEVLAPHAVLWPKDIGQRAQARSLCAEMHSGFTALRSELPMNIRLRRDTPELSSEAKRDVERIFSIWSQTAKNHGNKGNFMFGDFGIVDAFFIPVHLRFLSYGIEYPNEDLLQYKNNILSLPFVQEWIRAAEIETEKIAKYD